ncbi:radical SAM family heme chaperone HemW [Abyssisolibacter fermentans]|uniref:radical SAM family heme chaperone HemW n=1 Tax=Abyssisolibacter fermentans TaxID=1766203 RepID=UPI00082EDC50|nr:radical SAM family heme chaperone HemW [Abyssisolibacter fermentans]
MKQIGLYFHIPFCKSKCYYCDFISFPRMEHIIETYIKYVMSEIKLYTSQLADYKVTSIFIGGGTPSSIDSKYIYQILDKTNKVFNLDNDIEISIEANPSSIDKDKLRVYKSCGINRISMGVQSLNDRLLKSIGRIHDQKTVLKAYHDIRESGFDNVNFDIMFNLPLQSIDDVMNTLQKTVELDVEHISLYSLKLEENTPFYRKYEKGELILPNEDVEREMYHESIDFLEANGYHHYEISNFSKKNYECKHNLIYWKLKPYLGFGLAAHSNIGNNRWSNNENFEDYFKNLDQGIKPINDICNIEKDKMAEYTILGLRLIEGIDIDDFRNKFEVSIFDVYREVIEKYHKNGLLSTEKNRIKLTRRGLDLSNQIFCELMP